MPKKYLTSIELRETERQKIAAQIEQFLNQGGNIDKVKTEHNATRPISKSWSNGMMAELSS